MTGRYTRLHCRRSLICFTHIRIFRSPQSRTTFCRCPSVWILQTRRWKKPDSNRGSSCEGGCCFRPETEGRITKRGRSRKRHLLQGPTSDPPSSGKCGLAASRARMLSSRSVSAQAWVIGYFAKISSARLKALSIAASGAIPFFITSNSAMLNTCSASTCAIAGL